MATVRNAIIMQDRMTPVFNKILNAMQKTLAVMEGLDAASSGVMADTKGIKQAQNAINAARNDVIKFQSELDALNNTKVNVAMNTQRQKAQQVSGFTNVAGVSDAQAAAIPPTSLFVESNVPRGAFIPLTRDANEAQAAALRVQSAINGIRGPNIDATSAKASMEAIYNEAQKGASQFTQVGSTGSKAGRAIAQSMNKARQNASGVNTESLKVTKALSGIDYKAIRLGSNDFGQQMKKQLSQANREAQDLKDNLDDVGDSANNAGSSLRLLNLSAAIGLAKQAWDAVSGSAAYMDNLSQIQARLNNINDGSQTTRELQGKIMAAANRSRGVYQDLADTVAKLNLLAGDSFKTNDEAIVFAEQLNKMFVVSGTSAQEASAAMYQLNQALASGRLQGDEFRSIIENAPMLANAIAESMGKSRAELKDLSSEGAITANVIKKAMADCADDVNAQFAKMPMTFGQAMNTLNNEAVAKFQEVANTFSSMINSDDIAIIADALGVVITTAAYIAMGAISALSTTLGFLQDNMAWIAPIVLGVAAAFAVYYGKLLLVNGAHLAVAASQKVLTAAKMVAVPVYAALTGATMAETAAQWGLNSALYKCPIVWIIIAIIALIALVYAVCGALNTFAGTSISATGIVAGVFFALGAIIYNVFMACYNVIAWFINWFARIWNNPEYAAKLAVGNIAKGILDMCISGVESVDNLATALANAFIWAANKAIGAVNGLIDLLNNLPGVDIGKVDEMTYTDSALSDQLNALNNAKADIDSWIGEKPEGWDNNVLDYGDFKNIGDSFNNGYEWGKNFESSLGDFGKNLGIPDMSDLGDQLDALKNSVIDSAGNPTLKGGKLDSVGKIEDDVSLTDEDIKMLKDIASTKFVNKFTTLQPNMSVSFGDVHETADVKKIMEAIEDMTEEALAEVILEEN